MFRFPGPLQRPGGRPAREAETGRGGKGRWSAKRKASVVLELQGSSISIAFQRLADRGHDPGNSGYGQAIGKVNVTGRLDCLRKAGYVP